MATMEQSIQTQDNPRSHWETALLVLNWAVFAFVAVSALSWFAVVLMVIPYPELMAQAGESATIAFVNTAIFGTLSLFAGVALWLMMRRHRWQWHGQTGMVVTLVALFVRAIAPYF